MAKMTTLKAYRLRSDTITIAKGSILKVWFNFMWWGLHFTKLHWRV